MPMIVDAMHTVIFVIFCSATDDTPFLNFSLNQLIRISYWYSWEEMTSSHRVIKWSSLIYIYYDYDKYAGAVTVVGLQG